jgi:hypothetical protein
MSAAWVWVTLRLRKASALPNVERPADTPREAIARP